MSQTEQLLHSNWQLLETPAGVFSEPTALPTTWQKAIVPGTVAQSLGTKISEVVDFDTNDWWYRCSFETPVVSSGAETHLRFDGLATLAEVWLNGEKILSSRNMFIGHRCPVVLKNGGGNELIIRFKSLNAELAEKKPRPRWKTKLITHQNLRWIRATLLGRIPGWTPPITPVGPWRSIVLETLAKDLPNLQDLKIQTEVQGRSRRLRISGKVRAKSATLHLEGKVEGKNWKHSYPLTINGDTLSGDLSADGAPLWWPHTHGEPALLNCRIELKSDSASTSGAQNTVIDCGRIGFKSISMDRAGGKVELQINGVPIFCRGACWTIDDFLSLTGTEASLRETLSLAQSAGLNMLRVGGTMVYESDDFYRLCDELGILVWQDFMFANMSYPVADPEFRAEIDREVSYQLTRFQKHPCIAIYCGGSEVQQQAAMMGLPETEWSNEFFDKGLPELCEQLHRGIPYFPSSPCEGSLPFHVGTGISHYYGVGAYLRPISDVKNAGVKFTSECLGFSNVPEQNTVDTSLPSWKARIPRDSGTDWDFEDVRDHYTKELFKTDPIALRDSDLARYHAISRVTTGEVMKSVFAEWRKPGSGCGGGLVWFFKDLWPGAGWGILDSTNQPKAVFYDLRRAWANKTVLITNEGLDGLKLHALNESPAPFRGILGIEVFKDGKIRTVATEVPVEVPAHSTVTLLADAMIGYFTDLTYSYRFGAPQHDVVRAYLKSADSGEMMGEDFFFPLGLAHQTQDAKQVQANVTTSASGGFVLTLSSSCFVQNVHLAADGYDFDDNYFHLAPGCEKQVHLNHSKNSAGTPLTNVRISALNLRDSVTVLTV